MAKEFVLKDYLKNGIRVLSYKYSGPSEAFNLVRIPRPDNWPNRRVKWVAPCNKCKVLFERSGLQADHIEPIIPVTGWPEAPRSSLYEHNRGPDMNVLVYRCFVKPTDYQMLCKPCHKEKSKRENEKRQQIRTSSKL